VDLLGRTKTNFGVVFNLMQCELDDSLNKANKIAKHGAIKDDRILKSFLKIC
jgi:hypothetical protein